MTQEPATLFGVALVLDRDDADALRKLLTQAFIAQHHRPPGDIDADLAAMRPLRPGVSAGLVRRLVAEAEALSVTRPPVPEQLLIKVTETRALLTAEGRVMLDVLDRVDDGDPVVIGRPELLAAYARVADFYSSPHRAWMTQQARGGDLRPHVFAVAVLLLINGSIGEDRALRAEANDDDAELSTRLAPVLDAFARGMGGKDELSEAEVRKGLRSAWPYTEAGRQLTGQVVRQDGGLWIDAREEDALIRRLGGLLAARTRPRLSEEQLDTALRSTVEAYRKARPALASRRLAFERSDRTQTLRASLLAAFDDARGAA